MRRIQRFAKPQKRLDAQRADKKDRNVRGKRFTMLLSCSREDKRGYMGFVNAL